MAKKLLNLVKKPENPIQIITSLDEMKIMVELPKSKINKDLDPYWKTEIFTKTTALTTFSGNVAHINGPSATSFDDAYKAVKKLLDWKEMKKQMIEAKKMDFNVRLSGLGKTKDGDAKNANSAKGLAQMATVIKCMSVMFSRCTATVASMNTTIENLNDAYSNINGNYFHRGDRERKRGYISRYSVFAGKVRAHLSPAGSYHAAAVDDMIVKVYNDLIASGNAAIAGLNANHAKVIKSLNAKHLKAMKDQQKKHELEMQKMIEGYELVISDLKDALAKSQALNKKYEASLNKAIGILDKYDKAAAIQANVDQVQLKDESQKIDIDVANMNTEHTKVLNDNSQFVKKNSNKLMAAGAIGTLGLIALLTGNGSKSKTAANNSSKQTNQGVNKQ